VSDLLLTFRPAPQPPPPATTGQWPGRLLRALAVGLIAAGALALLDAGVTLVWQEPISAFYAKLRQDHLSGTLRKFEHAAPTPGERRALAAVSDEGARIALLAREFERHATQGSAVGRIRIPAIGASFVVVKGTSSSALQSGPGIYPETGLPGIGETTAIAGHRTTFLAPFRHIDSLRSGNHIMLDMPYANFTYTVIGQRVVAPSDVRAAVENLGYRRLVLSACTPLFSAAQRILVFGRLTRVVPAGAALLRSAAARSAVALPVDPARLGAGVASSPSSPTVLESLKP